MVTIYLIDTFNRSNFGKFYGWPDFFGSAQPVTNPQFESPKNNQTLSFLMQDHPSVVKPEAVVDVGTGFAQVVYDNGTGFGLDGKALIAEFGTLAPQTHLTAANSSFGPSIGTVMGQTIGQKIMIFNPKSGSMDDFISLNTADSTFRPTGIQLSPDGKSLYIASVGNNVVRTVTPTGAILPFPLGLPWAYPFSGVIWKVTHLQ
jgi:glucose/arabinose dehydrogenase